MQQQLGIHLAGHADHVAKIFVRERPLLYKTKHAANVSEPHATISANQTPMFSKALLTSTWLWHMPNELTNLSFAEQIKHGVAPCSGH